MPLGKKRELLSANSVLAMPLRGDYSTPGGFAGEFNGTGIAATTTGYVTPRVLRPFQQIGVFIDQEFVNRGASTRYLNSRSLGGYGNRFTVGPRVLEHSNPHHHHQSHHKLVTSDLDEHANTAGAYVLEELSILPI